MKHSVDIVAASEMYKDGMTLRQIAEVVNVPHRTLGRYLKRAGVELRNPGAPHHKKLDDAGWLKAEYAAGKSTTEIAKQIGVSAYTVSVWMGRHDIARRGVGSVKGHSRCCESARRKMSKAKRGKYIGDANPNWRGGNPTRDPERNQYRAKAWVKAVKERDKWTCQECGACEKLHAHHIKRWKDYPDLRYDLNNGITLCHTCHEKAHGVGFKFRWIK